MSALQIYPYDEEYFKEVYSWVDEYQLSRPKRNIGRDFSDGVLVSEIVQAFHPNLIDPHNYTSTLDSKMKKANWEVLNAKVFKKINFKMSKEEIDDIVHCKSNAVEYLLGRLKRKLQSSIGNELKQTNAIIGLTRILNGNTGTLNGNVKVNATPDESAELDLAKLKTVLLGENFKEVLMKGKKEALIDKNIIDDDVELRDVLLLNNRVVELETRMEEIRAVLKAKDKQLKSLEMELIEKKII
jgi:hypothetical protein